MKTTLIFLGTVAIVLGIFAYVAVFGSPTGSYNVNGSVGTNTPIQTSTQLILPTSTVTTSSLDGNENSSSGSGAAMGSTFTTPPLTWPEGSSKISIAGASLNGNRLTFTLTIQTGASPECIPLNLRLVADEEGDLTPPDPASFSFPDSGSCNGAANQTYASETTVFTLATTTLPLLFTTGGTSNIFFEVTTSTGNGLNILFPGTSG